MIINNPLPPDRMYTDDGKLVRCKRITIPSWDMNTWEGVSVPHGLGANWLNILSVQAWIDDDAKTTRYPLHRYGNNNDPNLLAGGVGSLTSTNINLFRRDGGDYDNILYEDDEDDRGELFIWYHE